MKDKKATFINITPAMAEILKLSPDEITLEKFVESFIKFASENKYVSEEQKGYVIRLQMDIQEDQKEYWND
jgi:hypothetical protein